MRHGLDQPPVDVKGVTDQLLAVAGDAGAFDGDMIAAQAVYFGELFLHDADRIAPVGVVVGVQNLPVPAHQHQLGGGGAAVDAQESIAAVIRRVYRLGGRAVVAFAECAVLLLGGEQRRGVRRCWHGAAGFLHVSEQSVHVGFPVLSGGVQCRAQRDRQPTVFREQCVFVIQLQRFPECRAQSLTVVQGTAQEHDFSSDAPPLRQSGDGLAGNGGINAGGNVFLGGTLIQQWLDVGLGEYAAPRGDGVDARVAQAQLVHFLNGQVKQGSHLVDESARAAGTGAVHTFIQSAVEEDDLGILPAQFNDGGCVRLQPAHGFGGGKDLLDERDICRACQSQPGGAGYGDADASIPNQWLNAPEQLQRLGTHLRKVPLVAGVDQPPAPGGTSRLAAKDDDFSGRGADINADNGDLAVAHCQRSGDTR